jgi:SAM-dependent methyltransferase
MKLEPSQADELRALEHLHARRTLFEPAARRVVQDALARAGLDGSHGRVLEIGSGGGQLRRWLPGPFLPVVVHTEREAAFLRKFQQSAPQAALQVASAASLPWADGSVAGVLGLCVLDVVDLESVARELHRVLQPGGCVIQFWDLAPSMTWLCERQISEGSVLLPDCFSDPLVRAELPAALQMALPPLDFLHDLMGVPSAQLQALIALLRPGPTGLIDPGALERLDGYVRRFAASGADAARALARLGEDEPEAHAYKRLLLNAWLMLQQARGGARLPLELHRISSAQALSERLTQAFTAAGMQIDVGVRRARAVVPRPPGNGDPASERLGRARFAGRWLGTTAYAAEVPPAGPDVLAAGEETTPDDLVVEAGVLVMVARR